MDATELLKVWPTWAKANARTIFASPAWRMLVPFDEREATLMRLPDDAETDELFLDIGLDDVPVTLGLGDSVLFSDLHLLWKQRAALPSELLLALAERECGKVFEMLEEAFHKMITVKGIRTEGVESSPRARLALMLGDKQALAFSVDSKSEIVMSFGHLEYLDVLSPEIRNLTRPAYAEYATVAMGETDRSTLAAGDFIVPEDGLNVARWLFEMPDDEVAHICGEVPAEITFAQIADEKLPPVPQPAGLKIYHRGRPQATAELARVGNVTAVKVTSLLPTP